MTIIKQSTIILNRQKYGSQFDVGLKHWLLHEIKCTLLLIVTLGIAYPWVLCMRYEAKYNHTVVCGKRLKFIGKPGELLGNWFIWWLVSVMTFGIYAFIVKLRCERWAIANVIFEDQEIV